jgi:hypothetical protein
MLPFLKRKATAELLGITLFRLIDIEAPETARKHSNALELLGEGADRKHHLPEIMMLTAFTIDYTVTAELGEGPTASAVLAAFYAHWEQVGKQDSTWGKLFEVFEVFQSRALSYAAAVRSGHPNGLPFAIGKAYSEVCGHSLSTLAMLAGSTVFTSTFRVVSKILGSCKIVD